ncbi:hypothetical protein ACC688_36950, partial [Rhizobium ruizarguesonis]
PENLPKPFPLDVADDAEAPLVMQTVASRPPHEAMRLLFQVRWIEVRNLVLEHRHDLHGSVLSKRQGVDCI